MKYQVVLEQSDEGFAVSVPSLPDAIREYLLAEEELNRGKLIREIQITA
jgi:hypothetical protein